MWPRPSLYFAIFLLLAFPVTAQDEVLQEDTVHSITLRALDKVTARTSELVVPIGSEARFGALRITAQYCRSTPPIEPPETYGYLLIEEEDAQQNRVKVFEGWMLASSPALHSLEHPVYDVWVLSCKASTPENE